MILHLLQLAIRIAMAGADGDAAAVFIAFFRWATYLTSGKCATLCGARRLHDSSVTFTAPALIAVAVPGDAQRLFILII